MVVTGERVNTRSAGFNPSWQRHAACYAQAAQFLGAGKVLDLGCGVGHSYHLLEPRVTVGVDLDAASLEDQDRETHVADMRSLPFGDASFASVVSIHSIEHVPDAEPVLAEVSRVLEPGGTAVFVTPNRLTFGPPDEIIDPYHFIEYDPAEFAALCKPFFSDVQMKGLFGSPRYTAIHVRERKQLDRLLAFDPLRIRRAVPRPVMQRMYDLGLTLARRHADPETDAISVDDFSLADDGLDESFDLIAVCRNDAA
jgi:SAM-dependent methyltransferase